MRFLHLTILLCAISLSTMAQFAPPAGQAGSTAIHKDSSIFVAWASHCTLQRGLRDISDPTLGYVTYGDSTEAIGAPNATGVTSLGDGGSAIVSFNTPITNGPGPDFAVFENAFVDTFLELAFVEVSSDGINFHRFPATSNTQSSVQVGSFGGLDATKINNLAGKYLVNYGTPFDLDELDNIAGLDINNIHYVKIIDVVGCIMDSFARFDKNNNKINDPWRTDFLTGGFDLDAVGVIHTWPTAVNNLTNKDSELIIYPNPAVHGILNVDFKTDKASTCSFRLYNWQGKIVFQEDVKSQSGKNSLRLTPSKIVSGHYLLKCLIGGKIIIRKIIINSI